jgi:hypothetical protein
MIKKFFTKADIILFFAILIVGIASSFAVAGSGSGGSRVEIEVDGSRYAVYRLDENRTVRIRQGKKLNVVRIRNGRVSMAESTCKNQICVNHAPISSTGENIVCLPNKVVVTIEGGGDREYDSISN